MARLLTERFAFSGGKVDRTGKYPIIRGVLLCGAKSANRRNYKPEAFAGDRVKRYEGKPVYVNHGQPNASRDYRDQLGWVENARLRDDGMPVGDIAIKPTHSIAESVLWDAEHRPSNCGMSHVAHCETKPGADGWDDVTEMVEAESVDLVVGPATTKGLYESKGNAVLFSFKRLAEWMSRHPKSTTAQIAKAKKLAEDMGGMGLGDAPALDAEPATDADPDATVADGIKAAGHAAWDAMLDGKMDMAAMLSKLKDLAKDHGKYTGDKSEPEKKEEPESKAEEGKKPLTLAAVIAEAKAFGLNAQVADIAVLTEIPTAVGRKAYCESILARAGEKPQSVGRQPGPGQLPEKSGSKKTEEQAPPSDGKAFAKWLQE